MPTATIQKPKRKKSAIRRSKSVTQYTYADYLRLPADERYEIINGKLRKMSPSPSFTHQEISGDLFFLLKMALSQSKPEKCKIVSAPIDVILTDKGEELDKAKNIIQPDIVVVCDEDKITNQGIVGAPDFIIEVVSPSSIKIDTIEKFKLYERYGVKEYWIVFPSEKVIQAFLHNGSNFELKDVYTQQDKARSYILGVEFDMSKVFPLQ